ncbi:MAG: TIGR03936 family radical SAM-associated protein [Actinomycetota bacterium]|nr:TIGR03936 family radical SAM-associated protein [Actinomycetota bacterium]MDQ6938007.1 TIGR03936 family radical SAM-associated protein [Actinomycetota bacterium]
MGRAELMARRVPSGPPPPPVVQRIRLRYAKRGRLRFTSHRDFARAFERALRRAEAPMAYSAGFSPHPKISYVGAAPTGVASEAEYLEIGLARIVDPVQLCTAIDAALPDGLDIVEAVPAGPGSLAERVQASHWRLELPADHAAVSGAVAAFLACDSLEVERPTKGGTRTIDARGAVLSADVSNGTGHPEGAPRAIMELVVRQVTPAVRPDDVLAALRRVAGLALVAPPVVVRLAQGPLDARGAVGDPLAADRAAVTTPL